jgi:hypothetical protein
MSTKTRFQKGQSASAKLSASAGSSGTTKKVGASVLPAGSETATGGRGNIQVIYNGKIVTPASLHARPAPSTTVQAPNVTKAPASTAIGSSDDAAVDEEKEEKSMLVVKPSANTRRYVYC